MFFLQCQIEIKHRLKARLCRATFEDSEILTYNFLFAILCYYGSKFLSIILSLI